MISKRYGILAAIAVSSLAVFLVAQASLELATAQENQPEQSVPQPSRTAPTIDNIFAKIERELPGFAGYFYDGEGKLNVYVKDPESVSAEQVENAIIDYVEPEDFDKGIVIISSTYGWDEWYEWKATMRALVLHEELRMTSLDIDEKKQKLVVGLEKLDDGKQTAVNEFLIENNIPVEEVELIETGPIILESHGVSVSTIRGGIDIGFGAGQFCTNGFVADRVSDSLRVSVTNGHCEVGIDMAGDQVYRHPWNGQFVGQEVANTNLPGPRYSDSLLWEPEIGTDLGKIYKTSTTTWTITGVKLFPAVGESITKYGRQTHETSGTITHTGVDIFTITPYGTLWSQTQANYSSDTGDSGSPVFKKGTDPNVTLYGIHWGRTGGISDLRIFSPFHNVQIDQGSLNVN